MLRMPKDFWLYEIGQFISYMGDFCSTLALSWWILNKTGSITQVSAILAPAAVFKIILLPFFAPFSDFYARKNILLISDFGRGIAAGILCACIYFDYYQLWLFILLYSIINCLSALYLTTSSIVTQLIPEQQMEKGMRVSQAMTSLGGISGGAFGGLVVAYFGVFIAFVTDAFSFILAGVFTLFITSNTTPIRPDSALPFNFTKWKKEMAVGAKIILSSRILWGMSCLALIINFFVASVWILFPLYIKKLALKDADFLGFMESGYAIGTLVATFILGYSTRYFSGFLLYFGSFFITGLLLALLPVFYSSYIPIGILFLIGFLITHANIPYMTKMSLIIPDQYRARVNSLTTFMAAGITPLGIAITGFLSSYFTVNLLLISYGLLLSLSMLLMFLIPRITSFMNGDTKHASEMLKAHFPDVL